MRPHSYRFEMQQADKDQKEATDIQTLVQWMAEEKGNLSFTYRDAVSHCLKCSVDPTTNLRNPMFRQALVDKVVVPNFGGTALLAGHNASMMLRGRHIRYRNCNSEDTRGAVRQGRETALNAGVSSHSHQYPTAVSMRGPSRGKASRLWLSPPDIGEEFLDSSKRIIREQPAHPV